MTLLLNQLFKFVTLLHSENGTKQISWGLTLGAFLGFSPFFSLQTVLILMILFFFKVQFGAAFLSAFVFKFIAFLADPLADSLGRITLESDLLRPIWTTLYNLPILPYTRFNNSIVMGSFIFVLIISPLLYFIFLKLITQYREKVVQKFEESKFWKAFKASKFYLLYSKYQEITE